MADIVPTSDDTNPTVVEPKISPAESEAPPPDSALEDKDGTHAEGSASDNVDNGRVVDEAHDVKPENTKRSSEDDLPTLPLKRARTAYFIFADDKREEVKRQHPGEGIGAIAKVIGNLWSTLEPAQKDVYDLQAAKERERVSTDMQRLKDAGLWPEAGSGADNADGTGGQDELVFPIGRIRKICKLDPDVKGISKESTLLITKATELFCTHLGKECVVMAQMQNRRKLMPEDVVEVCSMKERFMFLKPDLVDLRKAQIEEMHLKEKENSKEGGKGGGGGKSAGVAGESGTVNTLESYFGKPVQS